MTFEEGDDLTKKLRFCLNEEMMFKMIQEAIDLQKDRLKSKRKSSKAHNVMQGIINSQNDGGVGDSSYLKTMNMIEHQIQSELADRFHNLKKHDPPLLSKKAV